MTNILLSVDSYKSSHTSQYPAGTNYVYSYIEARGSEWDESLFFGLQMFIKNVLAKPFTLADIDEAEAIMTTHGEPFNREGWDYILNTYGGYLPLLIKAVPEGTVLPVSNVLVTVVNTDPKCFWLTSYMETALLRAVWYPTTVATLSFQAKRIIKAALDHSCDDPAGNIAFRLHDFGARGVSSSESAAIGGCAHLVNFMGTDTVEALVAASRFYGEDMAGFSIPAAEHSTITSWGRAGEVEAYRNMLKQFGKPGALVAVVSDSYDLYNAVGNLWGKTLRQEVLDSGATVIVRPDSGDPTIVPVDTVEMLGEAFGYSTNAKGFKVLNPAVRVIQGDGININSIPVILNNLMARGFSAENLALGMGGGLLQKVDRDTMSFAMKCSAIASDGVWRDVYKQPKTDTGKNSKRGRLVLVNENGFKTIPADGNNHRDELVSVFRNGEILQDYTFADIRERAASALI